MTDSPSEPAASPRRSAAAILAHRQDAAVEAYRDLGPVRPLARAVMAAAELDGEIAAGVPLLGRRFDGPCSAVGRRAVQRRARASTVSPRDRLRPPGRDQGAGRRGRALLEHLIPAAERRLLVRDVGCGGVGDPSRTGATAVRARLAEADEPSA